MRKLLTLGVSGLLALASTVVGAGVAGADPDGPPPGPSVPTSRTRAATAGGDTMYWPVSATVTDTIRCREPLPGGGCGRYHYGLDLGVAAGTPVHASFDGVVTRSYTANCGMTIFVQHPGGWVSHYLHITEGSAVPVSTEVETGDVIGTVSPGPHPSTCWTGAHLHFEVFQGTALEHYDANVSDGQHVTQGAAIPYSFPGLEPVEPEEPPLPVRAPLSAGRDYNGDGHDDLFWIGPDDGVNESLWWGQTAVGSFANGTINGSISGHGLPVAGDFNGDGREDFIWYQPGAGSDLLWLNWSANRQFLPVPMQDQDGANRSIGGRYTPVTGDFNGDGFDDIYWYGVEGASESLYYGRSDGHFTMNIVGKQISRNGLVPIVGDYDGDGRDDIFWYGRGASAEAVWQGLTSTSTQFSNVADPPAVNTGEYEPVAGDFTGDGRDDVYWYQPGEDNDILWTSYGTIGDFATSSNNDAGNYFLPVAGDFNDDGLADIFWYGEGGAFDSVWYWNENGGVSSANKPVNGVYLPT